RLCHRPGVSALHVDSAALRARSRGDPPLFRRSGPGPARARKQTCSRLRRGPAGQATDDPPARAAADPRATIRRSFTARPFGLPPTRLQRAPCRRTGPAACLGVAGPRREGPAPFRDLALWVVRGDPTNVVAGARLARGPAIRRRGGRTPPGRPLRARTLGDR